MTVLEQGGAVAIPSRGLIHSRTIASVLSATHYRWPIFFSHDKPLPDSHERVVADALDANRGEWILIVEEDNVVPEDLLSRRADPDANLQVLDYAIAGGTRSVHRGRGGAIIYAGVGCMLVRRSVFRKLSRPWFDTRALSVVRGKLGKPGAKRDGRYPDTYFCWNLQQAGESIVALDGEAGHLSVEKFRKGGPHEIVPIGDGAA